MQRVKTCLGALGAAIASIAAPRRSHRCDGSAGSTLKLHGLEMAAAAFQPSQEGVSSIVSLLTDVHQPGANQSEVGGRWGCSCSAGQLLCLF